MFNLFQDKVGACMFNTTFIVLTFRTTLITIPCVVKQNVMFDNALLAFGGGERSVLFHYKTVAGNHRYISPSHVRCVFYICSVLLLVLFEINTVCLFGLLVGYTAE